MDVFYSHARTDWVVVVVLEKQTCLLHDNDCWWWWMMHVSPLFFFSLCVRTCFSCKASRPTGYVTTACKPDTFSKQWVLGQASSSWISGHCHCPFSLIVCYFQKEPSATVEAKKKKVASAKIWSNCDYFCVTLPTQLIRVLLIYHSQSWAMLSQQQWTSV